MSEFFVDGFLYLAAAAIAVPLAVRFGLGSVLGYLFAGIVIGPVLGLVGGEMSDVQHFAEFGVVMMLFVVGLELEPRLLWSMRWRLLGLGGLQVLVTGALITAAAAALGQPMSVALAVGMILALSSTAIVLQSLSEKGLANTEGGRSAFSVLLFQDIAVIPMLAVFPLLALPEVMDVGGHGAHDHHGAGEAGGHSETPLSALPGWVQAIAVPAAVAVIVLGGHYLSRPLFRYIAQARLREVFTTAALLLVVGIALLMTLVGLSPALGAFLAGVVLANSEFRHELEADIAPFKGLLLGLFFITVGAGVNVALLRDDLAAILGLTVGVIALKGLVLFSLAKLYRLPERDGWLFALGLAQAGEFGFVLVSFSLQNNVLPAALAERLSLVIALSMLLTPALFILYERLVVWKPARAGARDPDAIDEPGAVIVAGLGRFGQIVNRMLLGSGFTTVVLDHRAELVENLRQFGVRSFYGDASQPDLLHAAGLGDAKALVVAIDDMNRAEAMIRYARRERPDLAIIARAAERQHVYILAQAGADHVVRELFESSVRAGKHVLSALGMHPYEVEKRARAFVDHDRETLARMAEVWDPNVKITDNAAYVAIARERNALEAEAMRGARTRLHDASERGWTPPPKGYAEAIAAELAGGNAASDVETPPAPPSPISPDDP